MAQWLRPNCGLSDIDTIARFASSDVGRTDPKQSAPTSVHMMLLGAIVTPTQRYVPNQSFVGDTVPLAAHATVIRINHACMIIVRVRAVPAT